MKILVADENQEARTALTLLAESAGYEVLPVTNGESASRALEGPDPPAIALLETRLPGLGGLDVCRRARANGGPYAYLMLATGPGDPFRTVEAFEAGADDVVAKPWSSQELVARLRAGERIVGAARRGTAFQSALAEALSGNGGELVVRSGSTVGRVFTHSGRIVWVELPGDDQSLYSLLNSAVGLSADDWRGIVEECRVGGCSIFDGIARWGIADAATVATCTKTLIASRLERLAAVNGTALFLPQSRGYAGGLSFGLGELGLPVAPQKPRPSGDVQPAVTTPTPLSLEARKLVTALLEIPGARAAAVVDLDSSEISGRAPDPGELEACAHAHGRAIRALAADDRTDEVVSSCGGRWNVLVRLAPGHRRCLYVALEDGAGTLGGARSRVRQVAAQWLASQKRRDEMG